MPAGRPTVYTPELLAAARDYVAAAWEQNGEKFPSTTGLALHLGISRQTCNEWSKDKEKQEFSDIYDQIMAKQEMVLFSNGLDGVFNATITKLMLTKHGYSDKQEVDQNNTGEITFKTVYEAKPEK